MPTRRAERIERDRPGNDRPALPKPSHRFAFTWNIDAYAPLYQSLSHANAVSVIQESAGVGIAIVLCELCALPSFVFEDPDVQTAEAEPRFLLDVAALPTSDAATIRGQSEFERGKFHFRRSFLDWRS